MFSILLYNNNLFKKSYQNFLKLFEKEKVKPYVSVVRDGKDYGMTVYLQNQK